MTKLEMGIWSGYTILSLGFLTLLWKGVKSIGTSPNRPRAPARAQIVRTETKKSGLESNILKEGTGPVAKNGDHLTVHYTAFLTTGEQVDSSYDRGRSMTFKLGARKVIDGWEEALKGARAGEVRKVTIPASLAYGRKGSPSGKIPPNSTVVFDIEVLKIE